MDINHIIGQLIELQERKESLLEEMLKMTDMQRNLIKEGSMDRLTKLIEEKQKIIREIDNIDIVFADCYQELKKTLGVQSLDEINPHDYPELLKLKEVVSSIMVLLAKIQEIDKRNTDKLNEDMIEVKEELRKIKAEQQNKKIISTYTKKYAEVQGVFLDNKE